MLSPDAAMVLGLASTAMPFADCPEAEAERWLRLLRLHGNAGRALTALGVGEAPVAGSVATGAPRLGTGSVLGAEGSTVDRVNDQAHRIAANRGAPSIGTSDVLLAVMDVYGPGFDRVLSAYGTSRGDVIERLAGGPPV